MHTLGGSHATQDPATSRLEPPDQGFTLQILALSHHTFTALLARPANERS